MAYSKELYDLAFAQLARRKRDAQELTRRRREEIYRKLPRTREIDREMANTSISLTKAVLAGGDPDKLIGQLQEENLRLQRERRELLEQAGYPGDYLSEQHSCPLCQDEGYVGNRMCGCLQKILRDLAYQTVSDSSSMAGCTFSNFSLRYYSDQPLASGGPAPRRQMEEILAYCRSYADHFSLSSPSTPASRSLMLTGSTGLGKTHLSLAIATGVIDRGFGVVYGSCPNLLDRLEKEKFARSGVEGEGALASLLECDLLIIDDLGTEFSTSFTQAALYNLVNSRINTNRPTIVSTNLDLEQIEKLYGERMVSRLIGSYAFLHFYGRDIRQLKQLEKSRQESFSTF